MKQYLIILLLLFSIYFLTKPIEGFTNNTSNNSNSSSYNSDYDHYNHYTKSTNELSSGTIYYGPKGGKAIVMTDSQGQQYLTVYLPGDNVGKMFKRLGSNMYKNDNGHTASVVDSSTLKINDYTYKIPSGLLPSLYSKVTPNAGLPEGIPKSMIPAGQEDLYILKSQIVPPVCPRQEPIVIEKPGKCQPCPACERCPEPSFECKKVPNYSAVPSFLPDVMNTQFGP